MFNEDDSWDADAFCLPDDVLNAILDAGRPSGEVDAAVALSPAPVPDMFAQMLPAGPLGQVADAPIALAPAVSAAGPSCAPGAHEDHLALEGEVFFLRQQLQREEQRRLHAEHEIANLTEKLRTSKAEIEADGEAKERLPSAYGVDPAARNCTAALMCIRQATTHAPTSSPTARRCRSSDPI